MNAYDIDTRISNNGQVPLAPLVHVHEVRNAGVVMSDQNVKVAAAGPPLADAGRLAMNTRGGDFCRRQRVLGAESVTEHPIFANHTEVAFLHDLELPCD